MRDEVKIGDIIRAQIKSIEKTGAEITLLPAGCGVVAAFCPRCRQRMDLRETLFVCGSCGWKERRKLPGSEDESRREGGFRSREGGPREGGFRSRGPPRGGGFRSGGPRGGFRPREGGYRRPGEGAGGRPPRRRYEYGR
jgi:hypothetical protein